MSFADNFFEVAKKVYNSHHKAKNVEMEIRIGRKRGNRFDTSIDQEKWNSVLRSLKSYEKWEEISYNKYNVFRNDKVRITEDEETGDRTCIKKVVKENKDVLLSPLFPWALRFSASCEIPHEEPEEFTECFKKERYSFVRKGVSIDLTKITPDDMDAETSDYQIELELVGDEVRDDNTLYNQIYKAFDLIRLIEPSVSEDCLWAKNKQ